MTHDPATRLGAAIQVEGIHEREAHEIPYRLARNPAALPIDHARHPSAGNEDVPGPEITMHSRAWDALLPQLLVKLCQPIEIGA